MVVEPHITWYGGEPLLRFDIIKEISKILISENILFDASLITNGYLLNIETINQLQSLNISMIQITIDGFEEMHNKRRFLLNGNGTYKRILKNINLLLSSPFTKNILLKIRINTDKNNANDYIRFRNYLMKQLSHYNHRIQIYPGWVTGETNPKVPCLSGDEISKFVLNNSTEYYPENNLYDCMARHINSFLIDPIW